MRILIATTQVPFIRGGAEAHAEGLRDALRDAGHQAEIVSIPFKWYPPEKILDSVLACRLLDLSEAAGVAVDLLIGLKFPAYLIPHPNKVLWVLHQFRTAYDLWDSPFGDLIFAPGGAEARDVIQRIDSRLIPEARAVFANSLNVARRLKQFSGIEATPLYHPPPGAELFYCAPADKYLFFPSRICRPKRQALVLEALLHTSEPVRVRFAGDADNPSYGAELEERAAKLGVAQRVEWLGNVDEERKRDIFAHALGVIYPPVGEDYGYVTLEAMLSSKPVITCNDSGGPLEFIREGHEGMVVQPQPETLAHAMDHVWTHRDEAAEWGQAARARYAGMNISWGRVIEALVS